MTTRTKTTIATVVVLLGLLIQVPTVAEPVFSSLVYPGEDGRLMYRTYTEMGDTILDFSYCGYERSEVPIPNVPVVVRLEPLQGESTTEGSMAYPKGPDSYTQIQSALDSVAALQPDQSGFRGAVLLSKGTYHLGASLTIRSGVVLRGEGDGPDGTLLIFSDTERVGVFVGSPAARLEMLEPRIGISQTYVPAGSRQVTVVDGSRFKTGDRILIRKTPNQKWIEDLEMDRFYGMKEGQDRPWKPEGYRIGHRRQVTQVEGNQLTVDVPLPQSISAEHGGGFVQSVDDSQLDTRVGLENLRILSNYDTSTKKDGYFADEEHNLNDGVRVSAVNGWVRGCTVMHVRHAAVSVGNRSQYVTVRDCRSLEPVSLVRGGRRYSFSINSASMVLVYGCYAEDGRHDFVLGSRTGGPNAFVKCTALRATSLSEPHHRWSTGLLYDNVSLLYGGALAAINRGSSGSGHGWAGANVVFWNCDAGSVVAFDPQTPEQNFAIGYTGKTREQYPANTLNYANRRAGYAGTAREVAYDGVPLMGDGYIEHPHQPVRPGSLFLAQLSDRIGEGKAQKVIEPTTESSGPTVLFEDSMTEDWEENWFLDGEKATLTHSPDGLRLDAGTVTRMEDPEGYHAHHAVLWTKQEFEGDILITYDVTRVDTSRYGTILLYIQAQGIGEAPYVEDIYDWRELRTVPRMSTYFDYMNLLHISYGSRIRARRYPRDNNKGITFQDLIIKPDYNDPGEALETGRPYRIEVEKRSSSLVFRLFDRESGEILEEGDLDTSKNPEEQLPRFIHKGRIGLRQMSTRQILYSNFKVSRL